MFVLQNAWQWSWSLNLTTCAPHPYPLPPQSVDCVYCCFNPSDLFLGLPFSALSLPDFKHDVHRHRQTDTQTHTCHIHTHKHVHACTHACVHTHTHTCIHTHTYIYDTEWHTYTHRSTLRDRWAHKHTLDVYDKHAPPPPALPFYCVVKVLRVLNKHTALTFRSKKDWILFQTWSDKVSE